MGFARASGQSSSSRHSFLPMTKIFTGFPGPAAAMLGSPLSNQSYQRNVASSRSNGARAAEIQRADFLLLRSAGVSTDVNEQTLAVARRIAPCFGFQVDVIVQRAAQENVVPRAQAENGNLNFRVVILDRPLLPIIVEIGMREPVEKIRELAPRRSACRAPEIQSSGRTLVPVARIAGRVHASFQRVFGEAAGP